MKNRYHLMRHGESLANVEDLIISLPENGLTGYGLSDLGREQARHSALASQLPASTLIVASDFLRARQTAEVARDTLKISSPIELHPGLRERAFGQLERKSSGDYQQVWTRDEEDSRHTLFGVESASSLVDRLAQVVAQLESTHAERDILLVSHGDPLRFLQLWAAQRALTEHLKVRLFAPAEIRALSDVPRP